MGLTLSGGPGKGLGRSQRRCPRCRCSWSWGTWSPGQFSLVGGGKEKLLRNKEGGGEACEQRTDTSTPKTHPHARGTTAPTAPQMLLPPQKNKTGEMKKVPAPWGTEIRGGEAQLWGDTPLGCLHRRGEIQVPPLWIRWERPGKETGGGAAELQPEPRAAGRAGRLPAAGQATASVSPALPVSSWGALGEGGRYMVGGGAPPGGKIGHPSGVLLQDPPPKISVLPHHVPLPDPAFLPSPPMRGTVMAVTPSVGMVV